MTPTAQQTAFLSALRDTSGHDPWDTPHYRRFKAHLHELCPEWGEEEIRAQYKEYHWK